MYHRVRKKMLYIFSAILILSIPLTLSKTIDNTTPDDNDVNNNIVDFDEEYILKFNKKYGMVPFYANDFNKNSLKYTIVEDSKKTNKNIKILKHKNDYTTEATTEDLSVIPLELLSTTEDPLIRLVDSTNDDLTVIPLTTTENSVSSTQDSVSITFEPNKLPSTDNNVLEFDYTTRNEIEETTLDTTTEFNLDYEMSTIRWNDTYLITAVNITETVNGEIKTDIKKENLSTQLNNITDLIENTPKLNKTRESRRNKSKRKNKHKQKHNQTETMPKYKNTAFDSDENIENVPIFTELDSDITEDIPEDYYDSKDTLPTSAPRTDAISVLFGLAGSVVESVVETVAERVVPKSLFDLFKRMQKQNEALEAERLRSREENGGLGQFGRGLIKTISTGLSKPLGQLMESKANGSLDTDRGFVSGVATGVTNVANVATSVVEAFKDKVQAIYPGTVWCGDGHSAQARSGGSDLGLFFFTDTCCRQHDACKLYIRAGQTRYGLTNTGLFTRSHCSCDQQFRECLRRTNSLVSAQIGLTYFNVLGPQCFRRAHPIVKCTKKTRLTGQKCEEYELDFSKPKMWQWFDNLTF